MPTSSIDRAAPEFRRFRDLAEVRRVHTGHWFDRDTLRFFSCRLPDDSTPLVHGRYFVSSEQNTSPYGAYPRLYTVREVLSDGKVETIGEFQGYSTRAAAMRAAEQLPADYSAYLYAVLTDGELHNRRDWIRTSRQLADYCGAPTADARTAIRERARRRRRGLEL